jgi:hypothetical protein
MFAVPIAFLVSSSASVGGSFRKGDHDCYLCRDHVLFKHLDEEGRLCQFLETTVEQDPVEKEDERGEDDEMDVELEDDDWKKKVDVVCDLCHAKVKVSLVLSRLSELTLFPGGRFQHGAWMCAWQDPSADAQRTAVAGTVGQTGHLGDRSRARGQHGGIVSRVSA